MKKIKTLFSLDERGEPLIDEETKELLSIAEEVTQLLRERNLCIGEARQVIRECERTICQKGEEMLF